MKNYFLAALLFGSLSHAGDTPFLKFHCNYTMVAESHNFDIEFADDETLGSAFEGRS